MKQDAEIKAMLGKLSQAETDALTESIEVDGVRDPITLWVSFLCPSCGTLGAPHCNGNASADEVHFCSDCGQSLTQEQVDEVYHNAVVVDGYNRLEIATRLGLDVTMRLVGFETREEAKRWVALNQLGRRNLTPDKMSYCRGLVYNSSKLNSGEHKLPQNEAALKERTSEELSKSHGVSHATIERDGQFAYSLDALEDEIPGTMEQALSGQIPRSKVIEAAKTLKHDGLDKAREQLLKQKAREAMDETKADIDNINSCREVTKSIYTKASELVKESGSLVEAVNWCIRVMPDELRLMAITETIKALRDQSIEMQVIK